MTVGGTSRFPRTPPPVRFADGPLRGRHARVRDARMRGLAIALLGLLIRIVIALALALVAGLLIALLREGGGFREDFGIACLLVGCLLLLMAPAGHSPAMRGGTIGTWTASFFPKLVPGMTAEYSGRTLSASFVLGLSGIVMIALGAVLVG